MTMVFWFLVSKHNLWELGLQLKPEDKPNGVLSQSSSEKQCSLKVKSGGTGVRRPGFRAWLTHSLAGHTEVNHFTSLQLSCPHLSPAGNDHNNICLVESLGGMSLNCKQLKTGSGWCVGSTWYTLTICVPFLSLFYLFVVVFSFLMLTIF